MTLCLLRHRIDQGTRNRYARYAAGAVPFGGVCKEMELVSVLPVLAPQLLERSACSAVMGLAVGRVWGC